MAKNRLDPNMAVDAELARVTALSMAENVMRKNRNLDLARHFRSCTKEALRDLAQALQTRHEEIGTDFWEEARLLDTAWKSVRAARIAGFGRSA